MHYNALLRNNCGMGKAPPKTVPFSMRLEPAVKEELQRLADRDRRSLTNYIEKLLAEHLDGVKRQN